MGQFISGTKAPAVVDTAEVLDEGATATRFQHGWLYLDAGATAPGARWGGPEVKSTTKVGDLIKPGERVELPPNGAPNAHDTREVYLAFAGTAANDLISFTLWKE